MTVCRDCGEFIEFRYIEGILRPIHNCTGADELIQRNVHEVCRGVYTFLTRCPLCANPVYFYSNDYGSRVFFDELGWPWQKHECMAQPDTKNPSTKISKEPVLSISPSKLFKLWKYVVHTSYYELELQNIGSGQLIHVELSATTARRKLINPFDLQKAPFIVVCRANQNSKMAIASFFSFRTGSVLEIDIKWQNAEVWRKRAKKRPLTHPSSAPPHRPHRPARTRRHGLAP